MISPADFANHVYLVGASGSGKTSLVRIMAKHLEEWNRNGTLQSAFVYVDPKGDDSEKFVRQCNPDSLEQGMVHLLDPEQTRFSINPLELPRYGGGEREDAVSRYVGYFMKTVEEWYQQSSTFVQMERIFRALLFYMYLKHDAPTFIDMHDIIVRLQENGDGALVGLANLYGEPDGEMKRALLSIAKLKTDAFTPLLNRIEQFTTDPTLKRMFSVRHGTVDFEELILPGRYTIVRISPLNMPYHVQSLAMQTFVLKLWFAIQERANRTDPEQRTQVVLALDEFQIVKDLQALQLMLEQARSLGLGLVLAHQTTEQISDRQLSLITGNSGTQFVGRVNGRDAVRMAQMLEPGMQKKLAQHLASQEYFRWTMREKAEPGREQPLPAQFWLRDLPPQSVSGDLYGRFLSSQRARYGRGIVEDAIARQELAARNKWRESVSVVIPDVIPWKIMAMLRTGPLRQHEMVERLRVPNRSVVADGLKYLASHGLVRKTEPENHKSAYALGDSARAAYFEPDFADVGSAEETGAVSSHAFDWYLKQGMFVAVASQKVVKGQDRTDLVAYDYENRIPISVEIESASEVQSHPEHVRYNMIKWNKHGFEQCHVWSKSARVRDIYDSLSEDERVGVVIRLIDKAAT